MSKSAKFREWLLSRMLPYEARIETKIDWIIDNLSESQDSDYHVLKEENEMMREALENMKNKEYQADLNQAPEWADVKKAVEVLVRALKADRQYRLGWQANIAMAFKDEYGKNETLHQKANAAANRFLSNLCETNFEVLKSFNEDA